MASFHPLLAARAFNTPLLIQPSKLDAITGALLRRWGVQADGGTGAYTTRQGSLREPGYRVIDGVAVIDVFGVLAHRGGIAADSSYILGYKQIATRLEAALADHQVDRIVLDIDSPGGEVAGAFELSEQIRAADSRKPVYAVADSLAASAAYLVGSAAREFSVTRTGYAGSIGVVWRHVDFSRAMEQDGIGVTQLYSGKRKTAGNPFEPLPDDVRAEFQADIDTLYGMFVDAVAAHRGVRAQRVRDTEARVYMGRDAVAMGLADRVETADEMLARISGRQRGSAVIHRTAAVAPATRPARRAVAQAVPPTADLKQVEDRAYADGFAAGRAERERLRGILQSDVARGREALARHCAFDACMSVEESLRLLSSAPQASSRPLGRLDAAMAAIAQPNIGPDSAEAEMTEPEAQRSLVSAIAAGAAMSNTTHRR